MTELNTADESDVARRERHASWAELFFDLVVVAGVAALAHVLSDELDAKALGLYTVLFLAFWLSWTTFMLYSNVAAAKTHVLRLMIGMFGLGVMAASVPGVAHTVLGDGTSNRPLTVFALAYMATRIYGSQSWRRGEVLLDFPVVQYSGGLLPWFVSIWVGEPWKIALWAVGVGLDLLLILVLSGHKTLPPGRGTASGCWPPESHRSSCWPACSACPSSSATPACPTCAPAESPPVRPWGAVPLLLGLLAVNVGGRTLVIVLALVLLAHLGFERRSEPNRSRERRPDHKASWLTRFRKDAKRLRDEDVNAEPEAW